MGGAPPGSLGSVLERRRWKHAAVGIAVGTEAAATAASTAAAAKTLAAAAAKRLPHPRGNVCEFVPSVLSPGERNSFATNETSQKGGKEKGVGLSFVGDPKRSSAQRRANDDVHAGSAW